MYIHFTITQSETQRCLHNKLSNLPRLNQSCRPSIGRAKTAQCVLSRSHFHSLTRTSLTRTLLTRSLMSRSHFHSLAPTFYSLARSCRSAPPGVRSYKRTKKFGRRWWPRRRILMWKFEIRTLHRNISAHRARREKIKTLW